MYDIILPNINNIQSLITGTLEGNTDKGMFELVKALQCKGNNKNE